jgi:glycosyltransferase involved in cell wall biosynthesis
VIVCVQNEEATIGAALREIRALPLWKETIVILNGSTDYTLQAIEEVPDTTIIQYEKPLGHDVGRALGAKKASGDVLLFVDGDMVAKTEELFPFVCEIAGGGDLALNQLTPLLPTFVHWDGVTLAKAFLNAAVGREDLRANSMTAVPHALSRRALQIGTANQLMVPPKMQVRLMLQPELKISAPATVDVIKRNRIRVDNVGASNKVGDMIIGDHMEALAELIRLKGKRGLYPDTMRKRTAFHA